MVRLVLTERQKKVLDFIQREQRDKGFTPSTREIQNHFRFASQTSVMQRSEERRVGKECRSR